MISFSSAVRFGMIGLMVILIGCSMFAEPESFSTPNPVPAPESPLGPTVIPRDSLSSVLNFPDWLAVDTASRVFVGDYKADVYRSIDQGRHWVELDELRGLEVIWDLAVGPSGAVFISGYGDTDSFFDPLWRSKTAGDTWQQLLPRTGLILTLEPWEGDTLYAGTNSGLWWSVDQGTTWSWAGLDSLSLAEVCQTPTGTRLAIAKVTFDGILYRKPQGRSWQRGERVKQPHDLLCASSGTVLIGRQRHDEAPGGLLRSGDDGKTWTEAPEFTGEAVQTLLELPSGVFLAGGAAGLWRSTDDGISWQPVISDGWVSSLAYDGSLDRIYAGLWGRERGVAIRWSEDGGRSWH